MVLAVGSIVAAIFRTIFALLDSVVYMVMTRMYNLFTDIASINLFGADGVGEFGTRIYTIIGVIMLFKLAFSILTYIIDPDKMTDNKNGFGTIVKDIVIMFVLIVTVPLIFRTAMGLQYLVLEDDTIGRLVTGHHGGDYKSMGDRLSSTVLLTFIHPNEDYFGDCAGLMSKDDELYDSCIQSLAPYPDVQAQLKQVYEDETFGRQHILRLGMMTDKVNGYADDFVVTYHILLSTIVGAFVAYVLLVFCIDIATRTVKLAFLQLIAPIPIVAYMDEKGKSGMFKKWVDTCRNTYLDLFIRLAGIDFALYLIAEFIYNSHPRICHWKLEGTILKAYDCRYTGLFTTLFLILGVLVFAQELPKMIEEITGVKLDGKFSLNPLNRLESGGIGKAFTGGLAGFTQGAIGAATGAGALSMLTGAGRGMFRHEGLAKTWSAQREHNKNMRIGIQDGSTFAGRMNSRMSNFFGLPGATEELEQANKRLDENIKDVDNRIKATQDSITVRKGIIDKSKAIEDRAVDKIKNMEAGQVSLNYKALENRAEQLREAMRNGQATAEQVAQAEMAAADYLHNTGMQDYMDNVSGRRTGARAYTANGASIAADATYTQSDATMSGQFQDLYAMVANHTGETYDNDGGNVTINATGTADAATLHSFYGQLAGSVTYDTRNTITPADEEKRGYEQGKADNYDALRTAKANDSAIK